MQQSPFRAGLEEEPEPTLSSKLQRVASTMHDEASSTGHDALSLRRLDSWCMQQPAVDATIAFAQMHHPCATCIMSVSLSSHTLEILSCRQPPVVHRAGTRPLAARPRRGPSFFLAIVSNFSHLPSYSRFCKMRAAKVNRDVAVRHLAESMGQHNSSNGNSGALRQTIEILNENSSAGNAPSCLLS